MPTEAVGKRIEVGTKGQEPTSATIRSLGCMNCGVTTDQLVQCSHCHTVKYCSRRCQRLHHDQHKELCKAIHSLDKSPIANTMFTAHMSSVEFQCVAKLIGKRCVVSCNVGGVDERCLYDTGAMVSLITESWIKNMSRMRKYETSAS